MKKLRSVCRVAIYITTLLTLAGLTGLFAAYLYVWPQLPDVDSLKDVRLQTPMRIYTRDGALVAQFGEKRRIPVAIEAIPEPLNQALIATEDRRFYDHHGVDFIGLMRAVVNLVSTGKIQGGGSTITMQLARNFFLSFEQTFSRKLQEIFLSWKIESAFDKRHILELYWNKINFGHRAYGVGAAAEIYYGKTVQELTLPELATIAGIPKGPSTHNPVSNPSKALKRRNHVLRRMWEEGYIDQATYEQAIRAPQTAALHHLAVEVYAPYLAEMVRREIVRRYGKDRAYNDGIRVFTTLSAQAQKTARRALRDGLIAYELRHGYRGPEKQLPPPVLNDTGALIDELRKAPQFGYLQPAIITKVDDHVAHAVTLQREEGQWSLKPIEVDWKGLQWARQRLVDGTLGAKPKRPADVVAPGDLVQLYRFADGRLVLAQVPAAQAAFVALDANDGAILALEGGFDFYLSKFNRVTQARRQPGSNIKPFIYSAALEKGFTAASVINDAPVTFIDRADETIWRPKNDSGKFKGPTRLRQALRLSTNLVSVRLLEAIGLNYAIDYLERFGLPRSQLPRVRSLALGTASLTPLEIARGYAVFANGGYLVSPYFIDHIEDRHGNWLAMSEPKIVCRGCESIEKHSPNHLANDWEVCPKYPVDPAQWAPQTVDPRNVYIMRSMLRDVIRRGTAWRQLNRTHSPLLTRKDIGGKTGTTNDARDAWFSGFTGNIVATAWVGFDDASRSLGNNEYGGKAALPIWQQFMETVAKHLPEQDIPLPDGIVSVRIDPKTGKLAPSHQQDAIFEIFRKEHVPTEYANNQLEAPLETPSQDENITNGTDIF